MASAASRMVGKVGGPISKVAGQAAQSGKNPKNQGVLQKGAKRDPELYVGHTYAFQSMLSESFQILLAIMTGAFGMVGYHFSRKPTSSSSEAPVSMAEGTMPWQSSKAKGDAKHNEHFKYQYHPGGDASKAPKDAPSALHSVIVPNVTLTKKQHDTFNKWGKDDW